RKPNEDELPSLSRPQESTENRIPSSSAYSHESRVFSPREEGEELSEEEYDERGDFINDSKAGRSSKPSTFHELEEGEASSDDDQRRPASRSGKTDGKSQLTSRLLLEEAEYRHRLHERHEKRQRERLHAMDGLKKSKPSATSVRDMQSEFLQPHPKFDPISDADRSRFTLSGSTSPENVQTGKKWSSSRLDSLDKAQQQTSTDVPYGEHGLRKSSHKRSEKTEHNSESQIKPDSVLRSYSTSLLPYERATEEELQYRADRSSSHRSKDREAKKSAKVKKAKRDRHGKMEEVPSKSGSRSHKAQLQFVDWESYVYGKTNSQLLGKRVQSPGVIVTSPRSSSSSSPSRDSASVSPPPNKAHRESTSSRKLSSQSPFVDPQSVKSTRRKHRHRYHREVRETAPPPESGRSYKLEPNYTESGKRRKHKQLADDSDQQTISLQAKRSRAFNEHKDQNRDASFEPNKYLDDTNQSRSKSRPDSEHAMREPHTTYSSPPLSDQNQVRSEKNPTKPSTIRSPFKEDSVSGASDQNENDKPEPPTEPVARKLPESIDQVIKHELRPGRFQHYRLYSESEDDDDDGQSESEDNQEVNDEEANRSDEDRDDLDKSGATDGSERQPRAPSKPFYFPSIQGCRSVEEFECLNRIEEGTYGVVYRARDKKINEIVALKRLKMEKERDGFPITSLREINTLMKAQHENIVTVREIVVGSNMDKIYLVMDYVEHDLKSLMEVGDFGLAREYGSPLKHYTEVVVTLWYRAPELLLGVKQYTCPIDLWSVGCIFAEFLLQRPLFPGKGEVDELNIIFRDLGTPTERIWPGVSQLPGMKKCVFTEYPYNQLRRRFTEKQISDLGFDLLNNFLTYCPEKRITADKALNHPYFNERPRAIHPSMFPSWPAKSEGGVAVRKGTSPRPPVAGGGALAAAAAAIASAAANVGSGGASRVRYQPPAPPMGDCHFTLDEIREQLAHLGVTDLTNEQLWELKKHLDNAIVRDLKQLSLQYSIADIAPNSDGTSSEDSLAVAQITSSTPDQELGQTGDQQWNNRSPLLPTCVNGSPHYRAVVPRTCLNDPPQGPPSKTVCDVLSIHQPAASARSKRSERSERFQVAGHSPTEDSPPVSVQDILQHSDPSTRLPSDSLRPNSTNGSRRTTTRRLLEPSHKSVERRTTRGGKLKGPSSAHSRQPRSTPDSRLARFADDPVENIYDISSREHRTSGTCEVNRPLSLKSLDRPSSLISQPRPRLRRLDPVSRYHSYRRSWLTYRAPGEDARRVLRWNIKTAMMHREVPLLQRNFAEVVELFGESAADYLRRERQHNLKALNRPTDDHMIPYPDVL
ncbi:kinase domain protein, partial [Opisthorchis viverrini]